MKECVLDQARFHAALDHLGARDPALAALRERHGTPLLWPRPPGFASLLRIVIEQQVSLASARAVFHRLQTLTGSLTPRGLLALTPEQLRASGLSRQKAAYCVELAQAVTERRLDLDAVAGLPDEAARTALLAVKGIGRWTADVYLLMALRRADVWPAGDLGLAVAVQELRRLPTRPGPSELEALGAPWRPWRGAAAWLLWHGYLRNRGLAAPGQ